VWKRWHRRSFVSALFHFCCGPNSGTSRHRHPAHSSSRPVLRPYHQPRSCPSRPLPGFLLRGDIIGISEEAAFREVTCRTQPGFVPCPANTPEGSLIRVLPYSSGCNPAWLDSSQVLARRLSNSIADSGLFAAYEVAPADDRAKFGVVLRFRRASGAVTLFIDEHGSLVSVNVCPTSWPPPAERVIQMILPPR
jgi:hypothetical protein